jgi:hypothetical protein
LNCQNLQQLDIFQRSICKIHPDCIIKNVTITATFFAALAIFKNVKFEIHLGPDGNYAFVDGKNVEIVMDDIKIDAQMTVIKYCARILMEVD